jgi:hypothetical protein
MNNTLNFDELLSQAIIQAVAKSLEQSVTYQVKEIFYQRHKEELIRSTEERISIETVAKLAADAVISELTKDTWNDERKFNRKRLTELTYKEIARIKAQEFIEQENSKETK